MWLREDPLRLAEWESSFQEERVLAQAREARDRLEQLGLTPLPWSLWPLRPFFFSAPLWDQVALALRKWIDEASQQLPAGSFRVNWEQCRRSPYWNALVRPDLFVGQGRTQLLEFNFGNGSLVAQAYVDALMISAGQPRGVLDGYLDWLEARFRPGPISLLASSADWHTMAGDQSLTFPPVLPQIVGHLERRLQARGWSPLRHLDQGARAILPITIGYDLDLAEFQGPDWRGIPLIVPFSSLAWEKSILPWLWKNCPNPLPGVELPESVSTLHPEVRRQPADWVLKRGDEGKHTLVGQVTPARRWNRVLDSDPQLYVAQRHQTPPRCRVPISPDGHSLEWREVAVEVSPFYLNYAYQGALVRWAPLDPSQLFSPPDARVGVGFAL